MADFSTFRQPNFAPEPQPSGQVPAVHDAHRADPQPPVVAGAATEKVHTFMSTRRLQGVWTVPPHLTVSSVMGTVVLDFTTAVFTSPTIVLDLSCFLGEVKIRVPRGVTAVNNASAIVSEIKLNVPTLQDPAMPQLILTGSATMSTVTVRGPKISLRDRIHGRF